MAPTGEIPSVLSLSLSLHFSYLVRFSLGPKYRTWLIQACDQWTCNKRREVNTSTLRSSSAMNNLLNRARETLEKRKVRNRLHLQLASWILPFAFTFAFSLFPFLLRVEIWFEYSNFNTDVNSIGNVTFCSQSKMKMVQKLNGTWKVKT